MCALSVDEFAFLDHAAARREQAETFLYLHLSTAARSRLAMDRATNYVEYAEHDRAWRHAVGEAVKHYRALLNMGGAMDALLAQMAAAEGLA